MASPPPGGLVTRRGIVVPASALSWRFSRSGGPGGQHANTADTRVELLCDLGLLQGPPGELAAIWGRLGKELRVVASSQRSQVANRQAALGRLARKLDAASRKEPPRHPTRPTRASVEARLDAKRRTSQRKAERRPPGDE